jgi:putative sigma-54 modulation protein
MNVTVTGRHMEMTEALKTHIDGCIGKLETHFDQVIDADVVLDVQKHRHIAEVNVHANGLRIHSRESSQDMYASLDAVMTKLEKQIRKYKERINRHQPRRAREMRDFHHAIIETPDHDKQEVSVSDESDYAHSVVQKETLSMKPMNVEEAIMQLQLIEDHPFLVFSNAETSQVNVLYSREDGGFGLIEPQF